MLSFVDLDVVLASDALANAVYILAEHPEVRRDVPGPAVVTSVATSGLAACLGGRHRGLRGALICLPDKASAA